jgi:hypothetical protein
MQLSCRLCLKPFREQRSFQQLKLFLAGLRPFKVIFNTDANELASGTDDATVDEQVSILYPIFFFVIDN